MVVDAERMDDLQPDFHEFDFLPGVDLYLWLRLVLVALTVAVLTLGVTSTLR